MEIYVVTGESGEYDDYYIWNVKAFRNPDEAVAYRDRVQARANAVHGELETLRKQNLESNLTSRERIVLEEAIRNELDPNSRGTNGWERVKYSVETLELVY